MTASVDQLLSICKDVLAPLIRADKGEFYVVKVEADHIKLHLAGRYAGCPGTPLVVTHIIEPTMKKLAPGAAVEVSNGWSIPDGASLVE